MDTSQGDREMVFCHQCENEWYRHEHGLTCPDCHSEFTEIIEFDHDPRWHLDDSHYSDDDDDGDDGDDLEEEHGPFGHHSPWDAPDPEEGVPEPGPFGNGFRLQRNGPNSYSITGTWHTSFGGPGRENRNHGDHNEPNPLVNPLVRNFTTMMQGITAGTARTPQAPRGEQQEGQARPGASAQEETRTGGGPRFAYTSTARLYPRDANNPGPHVMPMDDLHDYIGTIRAGMNHRGLSYTEMAERGRLIEARVIAGILGGGAFGPPPFPTGARNNDHEHGHGTPGAGEGIPPNPLAALFASLLNPQLAAHGDAVYSQEALDRVISQLMEQNATGNAPGPATPEAIAALPKKRVTRKMIGAGDAPADFPEDQLKGECSICMDEVPLGEEVTELPCGHWFHGTCIEAWLREHDTCPHCRKGIMKKEEGGDRGPGGGAEGSSASGSGSGSGNSFNNGGNGNSGDSSNTQNQPDDLFYPNMPGGLYTTSYRIIRQPYNAFDVTSAYDPPHFHHRYPFSSGSPGGFYHRQHDRVHDGSQLTRLYGFDDMYDHTPHGMHSARSMGTPMRQRRRSSFSRWASNVGQTVGVGVGTGSGAGAGGEERPGIGERLRSLFSR